MAISVALVAWAIATTPSDPTTANATAIGANLYWGYALLIAAILVAVLGACMDMLKKPEGLKGAIFSVVAIVAIVVVSYVLAQGHSFEIVDLQNKGFFPRFDTVITDASIMVTYVAMAGAIVAAIYSAVSDALK
ncbi:MAG: hypothetical protein IKY82_00105 [Alistipes sp.]|nr:hypothetical protein [Alistipes sp.]